MKSTRSSQGSREGRGNQVRQAGCALALARVADVTAGPDNACAAGARRAIAWLFGSSVTLPDGRLHLVDPNTGQVKLGLAALALAALQCSSLVEDYAAERENILRGIIAMQRDDGSFRCLEPDHPESEGGKQDFYPGQALTVLCGELHKNPLLPKRAIEAALPWYRGYFRRNPTTAFVPWQADAWRMFSEWRCEAEGDGVHHREAASFAFEMVDWLLQFQIEENNDPADTAGGFCRAGSEPGASTATYTEAIIRAFGLAQRLGDRNIVIQLGRHYGSCSACPSLPSRRFFFANQTR